MSQILHVIDFEGTRANGIQEYGVVTLVNMEISDTHFTACSGEFEKHIEMFVNLRKQGSFVGHNASVEDRLLRHYIACPGFVKETSEADGKVNTWGPWIDTKVLYKNFFREITDFSLKHLIESFDLTSHLLSQANKYCEISHIGYHNALFDALATSILLQNLVATLAKNDLSISIAALIEYSQQSNMI